MACCGWAEIKSKLPFASFAGCWKLFASSPARFDGQIRFDAFRITYSRTIVFGIWLVRALSYRDFDVDQCSLFRRADQLPFPAETLDPLRDAEQAKMAVIGADAALWRKTFPVILDFQNDRPCLHISCPLDSHPGL